MLSVNYRRIYHYHLKKCGGSTFNRWLDTLTSDERTCDPAWIGSWLLGDRQKEANAPNPAAEALVAQAMFHWSDVVHTHAAVRPYAPPGTFCFTILREPVQRLVSQVADWRRLRPSDIANETPAIGELVANSDRLPLRDFLERYGRGTGRMLLDNYMTRALAAGRIGRAVLNADDAVEVLADALSSLECDYDLIGLTENFDIGRNAFCAAAGLPPAREIPHVNASRGPRETDPEVLAASEILQELTRVDRVVYDRACVLFDERHRQAGETYDTGDFETLHASGMLRDLRGVYCDGATRYSVRSPITGSGFHGRDGARMPDCAVWTGPGTCTTLFIPVPPDMQLSLLLWVRGYAVDRQRDQIRVKVDGRPSVHHFESVEGYEDLLVVDACSSKDFVRLEIEIGETLNSTEAGCESYDQRKRGLSFDSYGWRLVRANGKATSKNNRVG
jgi:hypothetical protein